MILQNAKIEALNNTNFFPWVVGHLQQMNANLPKQDVEIKSESALQHIHNKKASTRIINRIKKIINQ